MFLLLILSGLGLYLFMHFGKGKIEIPELVNQIKTLADSDTTAPDTTAFELPPAPEEVPSSEELFSFAEQTPEEPTGEKSNNLDNFDIEAHLQLMRQNANRYNYKMAYKHGARIVGFLLANPELNAEWGHILLEAGKPQEAVSALQKITSKDTVKSEVAIDMAFAMLRSGNADGAIEFLDDKIKNNNDVDLFAAKAAIIGEQPDTTRYAAAEQIFLKCMKSRKPSLNADYWYGRFLMQRGNYQNSKTYLERAANAKPNEPRYIARLGMAEFYLKQDLNAETLYKRALRINPYDYNTWFNLGELYLSRANESGSSLDIRQKTRQALESYLKAIENDSLHAMANYRIGLILNGNGMHKEAVKHLIIALERIPGNIPIMQQLSSAYIKIGDTTKSVNYLEIILQIDPFNKVAANEFNRIKKLRTENL